MPQRFAFGNTRSQGSSVSQFSRFESKRAENSGKFLHSIQSPQSKFESICDNKGDRPSNPSGWFELFCGTADFIKRHRQQYALSIGPLPLRPRSSVDSGQRRVDLSEFKTQHRTARPECIRIHSATVRAIRSLTSAASLNRPDHHALDPAPLDEG